MFGREYAEFPIMPHSAQKADSLIGRATPRFWQWCIVVGLLIVSYASPIRAQNRALVQRGSEIVVSYAPARSSIEAGEHVIQNLRLPTGLKLHRVTPTRDIAIVTSDSELDVGAAAVEVDSGDVERVCQQILDYNRGVPIDCGANVIRAISKTSNDPDLSALYGLAQMSAFDAWDVTTGSSSVVVAVVDTGVSYNHPDLAANISRNLGEVPSNGIDDDGNGYIDDYFGYDFWANDGDPTDLNGHGTHCAGIVAGRGDNGVGGVGITWGASILPVRVLGADGWGGDADVAAGVQYAVDRGASIVSLSLGGSSQSAVLENAIEYARDNGVLAVVAAGNESEDNDQVPSYPANSDLDNVISVAATNQDDDLAWFSNYGADSVDIAAPGQSILSTHLANSYETLSGTSMATPYVVGVAALMKSVNSSMTYSDLRSRLFQSVDLITSLQGKISTGGRVNAYKAVMLASTGVMPEPTPVALPGRKSIKRTLSFASRRYGRQALLFGYLRDSKRKGVDKGLVYLECAKITARRTRSDKDGYFAFKALRPRRSEKCYAYDSYKNRSRSITVR